MRSHRTPARDNAAASLSSLHPGLLPNVLGLSYAGCDDGGYEHHVLGNIRVISSGSRSLTKALPEA
eukprot:2813282-Heterocapsa_arctica.AAC.1